MKELYIIMNNWFAELTVVSIWSVEEALQQEPLHAIVKKKPSPQFIFCFKRLILLSE